MFKSSPATLTKGYLIYTEKSNTFFVTPAEIHTLYKQILLIRDTVIVYIRIIRLRTSISELASSGLLHNHPL